jgi:hypothetical protein
MLQVVALHVIFGPVIIQRAEGKEFRTKRNQMKSNDVPIGLRYNLLFPSLSLSVATEVKLQSRG